MNEEPKNIWKKSWRGPKGFLLFAASVFLVLLVVALVGGFLSEVSTLLIFAAWLVGLTLLFSLAFSLARWLFQPGNFRRALFVLACLATMIALFYAEEDWRGWHAWKHFTAVQAAKGVKYDLASIMPPAVPDDQNFALTPIVASCYETYFDTSGHELWPRNTNVVDHFSLMIWREDKYQNHRPEIPDEIGWPSARRIDLAAWQAYFRAPPPANSGLTNCFPVSPQPQSPAEDVLFALSKYDLAIAEIREASRMPYSRFPLTYDKENEASILLPHLAPLKIDARTLALRAEAELQAGRSAGADVMLTIYLANAIRTEPFTISQLVRMAMTETALQPIWEGLADHRWSEPELIALETELGKIDLLADYQNVQRAEIGLTANEMNYLRRHSDYDAVFGQMGIANSDEMRRAFLVFRAMPGGWFYQSALRNARIVSNYAAAVDNANQTVSPQKVAAAVSFEKSEASFWDPNLALRKMFDADYASEKNFLKKIAACQRSINLARTAIALERYHLAHGNFPDSLDVLAPQFIAQVPHDVIGGQPLKYRRTDDGNFVLYSVGWNETDDGGTVVFEKGSIARDGSKSVVDVDQGDWVWRYPQK